MLLENMGMHTPRGEVKDAVGREHKDAAAPVFGERRCDVSRDWAELVEQFDRLGSAVDRDSFDAIVGSRPDGAR